MPPSAIMQLVDDVRCGSPEMRDEATDKLRNLGPAAKEAVPALLKMLLMEKNKKVRVCAASVLIYIGPGAASERPQLLRIFKDPHEDEEIRRMAASAIADMGADSLPVLCQCLKDPEPFVRQEAAESFHRIGPSAVDSLSALIEALEDDDSDVRSCSESSLSRMGSGVLPSLHESLDRLTARARLHACRAILKIDPGDEKALATLVKELRYSDVAIRKQAAFVASSLVLDEGFYLSDKPRREPNPHWEVLVPTLLEALKDPDAEVRKQCASTLGEMHSGYDQVVPVLLTALCHDPDEEVRNSAARSLGCFQYRAAGAVRDLMRALEKDAYAVQLAAIDALGDIGPLAREAASLLQKACKSTDDDMRARAKDALRKINRK